eukprot:8026-Pelagomonas_calceolata.AAC.1
MPHRRSLELQCLHGCTSRSSLGDLCFVTSTCIFGRHSKNQESTSTGVSVEVGLQCFTGQIVATLWGLGPGQNAAAVPPPAFAQALCLHGTGAVHAAYHMVRVKGRGRERRKLHEKRRSSLGTMHVQEFGGCLAPSDHHFLS